MKIIINKKYFSVLQNKNELIIKENNEFKAANETKVNEEKVKTEDKNNELQLLKFSIFLLL